MRPVTLALKGINSFEQRQVIDFERLTRQGVFGIFGPTGSGKSSILDGITLALYGEVARESRNFINVNMDQAFVEFTFLIREGGERCYRVARSFRRDKKSQSVRTAGAKLTLMRGEMEEVLAEKAKEVNQACLEIIGLSKEDFFRTVILPQGRFFEFLKLEGVSRSKMLERLFHLEKYGDVLSARVNARLLNLRAKDQILQGNMDVQGEVSRETIERLSNEEQKLQKEWELQKEIFTGESAKIRRLEKVLEIQETLERARAQVKRLEKQREEIEKSKVRAGRARKANAVQAIWEETSQRETSAVLCVEKWKQAEKAWKMAKASYEELWGQWEIFLKEYQSQKTNLAVKEERLERLSLEWQKYKEQRQRLEKVQAEKDSIHKELEGVKRKGEDRKNERDLLTKRRKESEETERQYQSGQVAAKILEDGYFCQKTCKRLTDEKKKLEQEWSRLKKEELEQEKEISAKNLHETQMTLVWLEVQKEQAEYQKLRKEHAKCVQQYRQKETSWNETKRKREEAQRVYEDKYREGLAAILAGQLKEGGPCPVCGSTHHPKKLQVSVDDVHLSGYRQERVRLEGEERRCLEELSACRRECEEKKEKAFQVHQLLKEKEEAYRKSVERITPRSWEMQSWSEEREREVKERVDILQQNQKELDESYARTLANLESLETRTRSWETEWAKESERLQECRNKAGILDFEKAWEEERNLQEEKTKLRETILRLREEEERLEKECQQSVQETSRLDRIYAKLEAEEELLREEIQKKKSEGLLDPEEELECVRYEKEKLEGGYQAHEKNVHTAKIKTDEWEQREKEEKRKADEAHIRLGESKKRLEEELEKSTFADVQTAKSYALEEEKIQVLEQNAQEYTDAWNLAEQKIKECEAKINGERVEKEQLEELSQKVKEREQSMDSIQQELGKRKAEKERMQEQYEKYRELVEEKSKMEHQIAVVNELYQLLKGKQFVNFAAKYHLDYIALDADERLREMSNGAYGMETDEEGIFLIRDYKNGGMLRSAQTLSGGETFMASLALALSLSARIQMKGKAPLELFFLDEGFGTLDKESLDVVMQSLERIHGERMAVGLITHVEEIKERVDARLLLSPARAGEGGSKIRMEIL